MPDTNSLIEVYMEGTVYVGTASADLTTNVSRRLPDLTGEMTARLKAIIASSGAAN